MKSIEETNLSKILEEFEKSDALKDKVMYFVKKKDFVYNTIPCEYRIYRKKWSRNKYIYQHILIPKELPKESVAFRWFTDEYDTFYSKSDFDYYGNKRITDNIVFSKNSLVKKGEKVWCFYDEEVPIHKIGVNDENECYFIEIDDHDSNTFVICGDKGVMIFNNGGETCVFSDNEHKSYMFDELFNPSISFCDEYVQDVPTLIKRFNQEDVRCGFAIIK